jgi:hypothetical protein
MASYPPPIQTLLISYFNPNNFINASAFDYTKTDTRYLKKNGDTSYGDIIAPNFTGLASSATNSTNINLTNEVLQNSGCLIPFSITATGNQPLKTNSSLKFNPNTGTFTTDFISTTGSITSGSGMTATGTLTANNNILVPLTTFIDFGNGTSGKDTNAGKMGYGTFSSGDSLDIVGAGTTASNRKVRIYDILYVSKGLVLENDGKITPATITSVPNSAQIGYTVISYWMASMRPNAGSFFAFTATILLGFDKS